MYRKLIEGAATLAGLAAAAGAATLTIEAARNLAEPEEQAAWRQALARFGVELARPGDTQRELLIAAATGAAIGMITYQGVRQIGRRSTEDVEALPGS